MPPNSDVSARRTGDYAKRVSPCPTDRHGDRAAYVRGCRCPEARAANTRYQKWREKHAAAVAFGAKPPLLVPVEKALAEISRLQSAGWSRRRIAAESGMGRDRLSRITGGTLRPIRSVRWSTYQALAALGDEPVVAPSALVDATGTWRRLEALVALGWPKAELARRLGLSRALQFDRALVEYRNKEKVAALYEELSGTPGPSQQARNYAKANGYAPPLAWDEENIDDPGGHVSAFADAENVPDLIAVERALNGERLPLTPADKAEVARRVLAAGGSTYDVARALRMNTDYARRLVEAVA